jgi:YcxB-like protein
LFKVSSYLRMEKEIIIKPSFAFKDYFKVYLYLYFNRLPFKILLVLISSIISFNVYLLISEQIPLKEIFTSSFIIILVSPIIMIFVVYRYTKKILSNKKLKENISIHFNENYIEDIGESFNVKYFWEDIKKIVEKKKWFLIYVDQSASKVIRKSDLKDNQYNELKQLFNSLDIKKKLK